jgi:hypothetical protein
MSGDSTMADAEMRPATDTGEEAPSLPVGDDLVPGEFPPLPGVPGVQAQPVHWLFAPLIAPLGLLLPRQLGPHLAASGWVSPVLVFLTVCMLLVGTVVSLSAATYVSRVEFMRSVFSWGHPADVLAGAVYGLQRALDNVIGLFGLLYLGLYVVAVLLFAWLLQPWVTVGEGRWRTWGRSVRLLLWSSAALLATPYMVAVSIATTNLQTADDNGFGFGFAVTAVVQYMVIASVIQGQRYAGPQTGAGWQPRELTCEECGQNLSYAPVRGACPECGKPVSASLPRRRVLPPTAEPQAWLRWPWRFVRTWWASLDAARFGRRIRVWSGRGPAIAYLFTVIGICAAMAGFTVVVAMLLESAHFDLANLLDDFGASVARSGIVSVLLPFLFFTSCSFAAISTWTLVVGFFSTYLGWHATYRHGVVLSYASGILIPLAALGCPVGLILLGFQDPDIKAPYLFKVAGYEIDAAAIAAAVGLGLAAMAAIVGALHVRKMLQASRYANA